MAVGENCKSLSRKLKKLIETDDCIAVILCLTDDKDRAEENCKEMLNFLEKNPNANDEMITDEMFRIMNFVKI